MMPVDPIVGRAVRGARVFPARAVVLLLRLMGGGPRRRTRGRRVVPAPLPPPPLPSPAVSCPRRIASAAAMRATQSPRADAAICLNTPSSIALVPVGERGEALPPPSPVSPPPPPPPSPPAPAPLSSTVVPSSPPPQDVRYWCKSASFAESSSSITSSAITLFSLISVGSKEGRVVAMTFNQGGAR